MDSNLIYVTHYKHQSVVLTGEYRMRVGWFGYVKYEVLAVFDDGTTEWIIPTQRDLVFCMKQDTAHGIQSYVSGK